VYDWRLLSINYKINEMNVGNYVIVNEELSSFLIWTGEDCLTKILAFEGDE